MTQRSTVRRVAALSVAAGVLGLSAAAADGAVRTSTYLVDEIQQRSVVRAQTSGASGTFDYRATSFYRLRDRSRRRLVVDHTSRANFVGLTRPAATGVQFVNLSWTPAGDGQQTQTCKVSKRSIPRAERSVSFLIVPAPRSTSRRLQIDVEGPDAIEQLSRAVRNARCRTPIAVPLKKAGFPPADKQRPEYDSLVLPKNKLRLQHRGSARRVVLQGRKRTPIVVGNRARIGTITVTTKVTLRLVGSTQT
ncbi:MAG: hypothetical protein ACR2N6_01005 [Miltoncostaeaceae bacterium]